jgi:hypothetical protein
MTGFYPDGVWTEPVPGNLVRIRLVTDKSVQHWGFATDGLNRCPTRRWPIARIPTPIGPSSSGSSTTWTLRPRDPPAFLSHRARGECGLAGDHGHPTRRRISGSPAAIPTACGPSACRATVGHRRLISDGSVRKVGLQRGCIGIGSAGGSPAAPSKWKSLWRNPNIRMSRCAIGMEAGESESGGLFHQGALHAPRLIWR